MNISKLKRAFLIVGSALTLTIIVFTLWLISLNREIQQRISGKWFLPPVEIFARPEPVIVGQKIRIPDFERRLVELGHRKRQAQQKLYFHDYSIWDRYQCQSSMMSPLPEEVNSCLVFKSGSREGMDEAHALSRLIAFDENSVIVAVYAGQPFQPVNQVELEPELFAQFYGGKPILRRIVEIGQTPLNCLQAITAIEDSRFLEHGGVSLVGMGRAMLKNLVKGRVAEGGSTITQQLVKNYFLTSERTFRRKFKEVFMALLLETQVDKDKILESYINVIYMGQNGPFQVRGYGSAAAHYFSTSLENLDLPQCSLLAAIVNSPGRYNPFSNPDRARKRRNQVIQRMLELNMIDPESAEQAQQTPLPNKPPRTLTEPAPYYVQAIYRELGRLGISDDSGLRIFSSLSPSAQAAAKLSVEEGLHKLEEQYETVKQYKEQFKNLEATLISVDLRSNSVIALIGGRSYRKTQFNRALDGHRQVGSIMKPFVYLAALESVTADGGNYHPLTPLADKPFTYKYEGQQWSPKNYDGKYRQSVPMFYALTHSLNAATAQLGLNIGLSNVIDVAKRVGVESHMEALPSLSLGAFELFPWEVAQSYSTLARMGLFERLSYIFSIQDINGESLYQHQPQPEQVLAPETVASLVGMMKENIHSGTGQSIPSWRGFIHPAAGKTGTTSDTKDAWFAGFTPYILTVVWVGYDDNTPHGLTGASGAIPMWTQFMRQYASRFPAKDFDWPEGNTSYTLPADQLKTMVIDPGDEALKDSHLIFRSGNAPTF